MRRFVISFVLFALATPAWGQRGEMPPSLSVNGAAVIKKQPEVLRMHLPLKASGATLEEAIKKLGEAKAAAEKKLLGLGAAKDSIKTSDINVAADDESSRDARIRTALRSRMTSKGKPKAKDKDKEPEKTVNIMSVLSADWTLKGKKADELLIEMHALQEKVKGAELTAKPADMSAEEEELAEEMAGMMSRDNMPDPTAPVFVTVAKISDADRAKAMAEAFTKAKAEAAELAKATGSQVGGLLHASSHGGFGYRGRYSDGPFSMGGSYEHRQYYERMMNMVRGGGDDDEEGGDAANAKEAFGNGPGPITTTVGVQVVFELKK